MEQLTTTTLEFIGYTVSAGALFQATCPRCGATVEVSQFGRPAACRCGAEWRLEIVARAGQPYRAGPSETK